MSDAKHQLFYSRETVDSYVKVLTSLLNEVTCEDPECASCVSDKIIQKAKGTSSKGTPKVLYEITPMYEELANSDITVDEAYNLLYQMKDPTFKKLLGKFGVYNVALDKATMFVISKVPNTVTNPIITDPVYKSDISKGVEDLINIDDYTEVPPTQESLSDMNLMERYVIESTTEALSITDAITEKAANFASGVISANKLEGYGGELVDLMNIYISTYFKAKQA